MFAGIDYLTCWSRSSGEANKSFYDSVSDWVAHLGVKGMGVKPATLYGTRGIRCEGVYIGIGQSSALLNVPGSLAQEAYEKFYNSSHTVTRLDIQVTCQNGYNEEKPLEPFHRYLEQGEKQYHHTQGRAKRLRSTLVRNHRPRWAVSITSGCNQANRYTRTAYAGRFS
jgi:hypothetical protein